VLLGEDEDKEDEIEMEELEEVRATTWSLSALLFDWKVTECTIRQIIYKICF
jgi:hypothetical protein